MVVVVVVPTETTAVEVEVASTVEVGRFRQEHAFDNALEAKAVNGAGTTMLALSSMDGLPRF